MKENERKNEEWKKMKENGLENERKWKKMKENERKWKKMKDNERKWRPREAQGRRRGAVAAPERGALRV